MFQFELSIPTLYDDAGVGQGNCTIGIGHLVHFGPCEYSTTNLDEVPFINGITDEQAAGLFNSDLERVEQAVRTSITVPLEQHQFDALVSFAFSAGENNLHLWPFVIQINSGQFDAAAATWLNTAITTDVNNDGTNEQSDGLIRRRAFEAELFREGNYRYDW